MFCYVLFFFFFVLFFFFFVFLILMFFFFFFLIFTFCFLAGVADKMDLSKIGLSMKVLEEEYETKFSLNGLCIFVLFKKYLSIFNYSFFFSLSLFSHLPL